MNKMDILFVLILVVSILLSLKRGFIKELFSFFSLVGGFAAATLGYSYASAFLQKFGLSPVIASTAGYITTLISAVIAIEILGTLLTGLFKLLKLSPVNRILGGIFGVFRGIFLILLIFIVIVLASGENSKFLKDSFFFSKMKGVPAFLENFLKGELLDAYKKNRERFDKFFHEKDRVTQVKIAKIS